MRNIKFPSNLPIVCKEIIDITDSLPKNPKGGWLEMPTKRSDGQMRTGQRNPADINFISVHHTATEGGTAEGHARYHVSKGEGGIAYHIYIKGDQSYQVNDLLALTWHTASQNYHTVGISVEGNFTKRNMTDDERNNLYACIMAVMKIFNIPLTNVLGHKEFAKQATSCPAFDMNKVRADLASIIEQQNYVESPANLNADSFAIVSRANDLYAKHVNKDKKYSPEIQAEAGRKLGRVGAVLRAEGWLA